MTREVDWNEVAVGIALISPLDELLGALITEGASTPVIPVQHTVSSALGIYAILHGFKVIK